MSKQCSNCHETIEDTAAFCPFCGAQQPTETAWENTEFWSNPAPMTGVQSKNTYPSPAAKGLSITLAVFCFLSAFAMLTLLLLISVIGQMMGGLGLFKEYAELMAAVSVFLLPATIFVIADAAFYVVFGILLLVKKSWKIALTITIYSGFWFLLGMIGGSASGIPAMPVIGVLCTIWLRKAPEGTV